jgi:spermidine/putrescine transport system permease protein
LLINGVLAFNNSDTPSLPWRGFTLDWFYTSGGDRVGVANDPVMLRAIGMSLRVALLVCILSLIAGTLSSFLFVREAFLGKRFFHIAIIAPLVIPGVITGIAILVFFHGLNGIFRSLLGPDLAKPIVKMLQPGFLPVVLGQFSFIGTIGTLVISARLRKFPIELEEAAMDLGASRWGAVLRVTIPYLTPSLLGAAVISFLLSFENFPITLFLIGYTPTIPIYLFSKLRFQITPQINAISVALMGGTSLLALIGLAIMSRRRA